MTKIYTSSLLVGITKLRLNSNYDRCFVLRFRRSGFIGGVGAISVCWGIGDRVCGGEGDRCLMLREKAIGFMGGEGCDRCLLLRFR